MHAATEEYLLLSSYFCRENPSCTLAFSLVNYMRKIKDTLQFREVKAFSNYTN